MLEKGGFKVGASESPSSGKKSSFALQQKREMTRAQLKSLLQPANYTRINYIALH